MRRPVPFVVLTALMLAGAALPARAQSITWQTVSNPAGYSYQVPADWVPGAVAQPIDSSMGSDTRPMAAFVTVEGTSGDSPAARVATLLSTTLNPSSGDTAYRVTNPSSPVDVAGADGSAGGAAAFVNQAGTAMQEYVIASVRGASGYVLTVEVPTDVDGALPNLAQGILASFRLTLPAAAATGPTGAPGSGAAQSPPASSPPPAPAPASTPAPASGNTQSAGPAAPAPAAPVAGNIYGGSDPSFALGTDNWAGFQGTETLSRDPNAPGFNGPALKIVLPGANASEGANSPLNTPLVAGASYSASVWVYGASGTSLSFEIRNDATNEFHSTNVELNGNLQQVTWQFTADHTGNVGVFVQAHGAAQATTFWIGSISVVASR